MKRFLLSLAAAVAATGLVFFFFMSISIPALALYQRLAKDEGGLSVTVGTGLLFRNLGLPLSGAVFLICFCLAWRRLRRQQVP